MGLFRKKEKIKKEKTTMDFRIISGLNFDTGTYISLNKLEDGISIGKQQCFIDYHNIIDIACRTYREEDIKNKSVIGRALVGGILTGGIGAVVGGISGVGTKKKVHKIYGVEINYIKNGIKETIILEDYLMWGTYKFIDSIAKKVTDIQKNIPLEDKIDISEQIKKISELKELGILTDEEFVNKKQELLSRI